MGTLGTYIYHISVWIHICICIYIYIYICRNYCVTDCKSALGDRKRTAWTHSHPDSVLLQLGFWEFMGLSLFQRMYVRNLRQRVH